MSGAISDPLRHGTESTHCETPLRPELKRNLALRSAHSRFRLEPAFDAGLRSVAKSVFCSRQALKAAFVS